MSRKPKSIVGKKPTAAKEPEFAISNPSRDQAWQLGDVARYTPRLIKCQRLGDLSIARIGVAVDIGHAPAIRVHDLRQTISYTGKGGSKRD